MLEWASGAKGDLIPTWNGRLLASKVDPYKEAKIWVESHADILSYTEGIFVLGLGAGYHIRELQVFYPKVKIIVFEALLDLVSAKSLRSWQENGQVSVYGGDLAWNFFSSSEAKDMLSGLYIVLQHKSSMEINPTFYQNISNRLVGRTWSSYHHILKARGTASFLSEVQVTSRDELISIKHIMDALKENKNKTSEDVLWSCLSELVK